MNTMPLAFRSPQAYAPWKMEVHQKSGAERNVEDPPEEDIPTRSVRNEAPF
jgi:hypothetical protein